MRAMLGLCLLSLTISVCLLALVFSPHRLLRLALASIVLVGCGVLGALPGLVLLTTTVPGHVVPQRWVIPLLIHTFGAILGVSLGAFLSSRILCSRFTWAAVITTIASGVFSVGLCIGAIILFQNSPYEMQGLLLCVATILAAPAAGFAQSSRPVEFAAPRGFEVIPQNDGSDD
jgi:hypothetical protein